MGVGLGVSGVDPVPVFTRLADAKVVGILRVQSADAAVQAGMAAANGGLKAIEVAFTTPNAALAIRQLREQLPPDVLLGAGTVMTADNAKKALDAGALFLASPHLNEAVLEASLSAAAHYIPGVLTPTEIARALALGAAMVKIFPIGALGGIDYLKDIFGPFPDLQVMATGGVAPGDVLGYLQAGARVVGLGSKFFPAAELQRGDWAGITASTRSALEMTLLGDSGT
jgi:2-dehydro-3-deoxyphosphogluconate aldolase/(4S)-4-hydroxy-2-oxoglutarate aldolase